MNDRTIMQQALEALEDERYVTKYTHIVDAITALRKALEQPEQEPDDGFDIDGLKDAAYALEAILQRAGEGATVGHVIALLENLAQPEQAPVAWQVMVEDEAMKEFPIKDMAHDWCVKQKLSGSPYSYWIRPLYTTPPAVPRKPLTDDAVGFECRKHFWMHGTRFEDAYKAGFRDAEAAHGIKEGT